MVEISVIVPVYNVENYLDDCLNHITNQSFKDMEIICINDESNDNSLDIINRYCESDERIIVINQKNQGAGACRNTGIQMAKGKYIYFCDSDDYLKLNALEELYNQAEKRDPDFIIFKLENFDNETKEIIEDDYYSMPYLKNRVGDKLFSYDDVSDFALDIAVCSPGAFFKREFIYDIKFPEDLIFEDNVFFTNALFKADKIYFYDKFLYNRRVRSDSLSKSNPVKSLDTIEITNLLLDLTKQYNHPNHKGELYYRIFNNMYNIFEGCDEEYKEKVFLRLKKEYLKNKNKWEKNPYFKEKLNPRYKHIFKSAINSDEYLEFDLKVKLYDSKNKVKKLKKENKLLKNKLNMC